MNFKLTQYCMWLNIIKKNWELIKKSASYYILIISFFCCFYHGILVWAFNTPCLRQVTLNDLQKRKNSFICEKETIKSPWKKEKKWLFTAEVTLCRDAFIKCNNQTIDQVSYYLESDEGIHNFNGHILSRTFFSASLLSLQWSKTWLNELLVLKLPAIMRKSKLIYYLKWNHFSFMC